MQTTDEYLESIRAWRLTNRYTRCRRGPGSGATPRYSSPRNINIVQELARRVAMREGVRKRLRWFSAVDDGVEERYLAIEVTGPLGFAKMTPQELLDQLRTVALRTEFLVQPAKDALGQCDRCLDLHTTSIPPSLLLA